MYSTDKSTESQLQFMLPGITENVTLVGISYEPAKSDGSGQMVLRFNFEDSNKLKLSHTEFEIDPVKLTELAAQWKQDAKKVIEDKFMDLGGRVRHILKAFLPEDKCEIHASSWEEFCKNVVKIAGQLFVGEKFRLKVVLNSRDMVTLPNKAITPFIQNMKVPNTLRINPKYDRVVAITPDPAAAAAKAAIADLSAPVQVAPVPTDLF